MTLPSYPITQKKYITTITNQLLNPNSENYIYITPIISPIRHTIIQFMERNRPNTQTHTAEASQ
jgi:hypothetical protein